jgi:hypothetical protein
MRKAISWLIGGSTAVAAAVSLLAAPTPASAGGVNPDTLGGQGWTCLDVVHAVHCIPPGLGAKVFTGQAAAFSVLVFDTRDPKDPDAALLGTEFNIRADLFRAGRPCPTDSTPSGEPGHYTYLPDIGVPLDYYACHRFDSPL